MDGIAELFVLLAARTLRGRAAPGEQAEGPKCMAGIDSFSHVKDAVMTVLFLVLGVNLLSQGIPPLT